MAFSVDYFKQFNKIIAEEINVKQVRSKICVADGANLELVYDLPTNDLFLEWKKSRVTSEKLISMIPEFAERIFIKK